MTQQKSIRLLVVENDEDDLLLIQEALSEMEEASYWRTWMRPCHPVFVRSLKGALSALSRERFDAALLDLHLPDSSGLEPLFRLRDEAASLPVVALADPGDESLAQIAVREGAQDYLVKTDLDCTPLARCLRYAIEREVLRANLRRMSFWDEATGLYSLSGFLNMAEHDIGLLRRMGRALVLCLADLDGLEELRAREGRQPAELALLETADILRGSFHEADLVASLGNGRFGILTLDADHIGPRQTLAGRRLSEWTKRRRSRLPLSLAFGAATLDPGVPLSLEELVRNAEQSLCENRRSHLAAVSKASSEAVGNCT